jgi:hypothetical protein
MNLKKSKAPPWMAASLRFTLLAVIILLLFAATAPGQSGWPPPFKIRLIPATSHQEAAPPPRTARLLESPRKYPAPDWVEPQATVRQDSLQAQDRLKPSPRHLALTPVAGQAAPQLPQDLWDQPAVSGQGPAHQCPLPPASAFSLQTNLRKYLETWPTPGATGGDDWPEYAGESEEDPD